MTDLLVGIRHLLGVMCIAVMTAGFADGQTADLSSGIGDSGGTSPVSQPAADVPAGTPESFTTLEYDLPESGTGLGIALAAILLIAALVIRTSLRDTRFLRPAWRVILLLSRAAVLVGVLWILLNPRLRTQTTIVRPSRVVVLVDSSTSMSYPAEDPVPVANEPEPDVASRATAVQRELVDSGLLNQLGQRHTVSVYTFDRQVQGPWAVIEDGNERLIQPGSMASPSGSGNDPENDSPVSAAAIATDNAGDDGGENSGRITWTTVFQPRGGETRLGESLTQLLGRTAGRTLSGIVVVTDGRSNVGMAPEAAGQRAALSGARFLTIGVGGTRDQENIRLAGVQAPSEVHKGDPFDVKVVVQSQGMAGKSAEVELLQRTANADDVTSVKVGSVTLPAENLPAELTFSHRIAVPGDYELVVEVRPADGTVQELTVDDNQRTRDITVSERRMRVLLVAGGPMRDYRFLRDILFRESGIESDVWLQTVTRDSLPFVSQEARNVLDRFPETKKELFEYDVVVAFDVDWSRVSTEEQENLRQLVADHRGGLIIVAGEIFTPALAREPETFSAISDMFPVILNTLPPELTGSQRYDTPHPVLISRDGQSADWLNTPMDPEDKSTLKKSFPRIYRSYPVQAIKNGAVVLATFENPRARTQLGQPPFLARQLYGSGSTLYVGSAETWRLRTISPDSYKQFWVGALRDIGAARRQSGQVRGLLLADRTEVSPGSPVTLRAQLYDQQMDPYSAESVPMSIVDSAGRPQSLPKRMNRDTRKPGDFTAVFRPDRAGQFRVTVPIPDSTDRLSTVIDVVQSDREAAQPSLNETVLQQLSELTGGAYLPLRTATRDLPELLPDKSEPAVIDEQLRTLWDRQWLMFTLAGLLGLEWLTRRICRLA